MSTVFFSGAGLSAASGVPTYRGVGGIYNGTDYERVLSAAGYRNDPARVERLHDELAATVAKAKPNAAHIGIATWQQTHSNTHVITQNVDDLLERAGCSRVVHLHGELAWYRCRNNPEHARIPAVRPWAEDIRCGCGARVRSDVVLFDEPAPAYQQLYDVIDTLTRDDSVVVIGTEGSVVPIASLLPATNCHTVLVNLHASEFLPEHAFDEVVYQSAPDAWPTVARMLTAKKARVAARVSKLGV